MEKKTNIGFRILAILTMLILIFVWLLSSFQVAIYGDSDYSFYKKEYVKYNVTESLGMTIENVMTVTDYMMDYLIGKEDVLSIETDVDGKQQDFFNEQDRIHMADVSNLFIKGLFLRNVLAGASAVLLALLCWKKQHRSGVLFWAYTFALGLFLVIVACIGVACATDFTKFFTLFHEVFFSNDLWLFDPATDYMIRMLPEGFFFDFVIRIGEIFIGGLVALWAILFYLEKKIDKNPKHYNK